MNHSIQTYAASRVVRIFAAGIMLCAAAQTHAQDKCPTVHKLTLVQVAGLIQAHIKEEIVVKRVEDCHVSFNLDAPSLDQLIKAGMSDGEFNALNTETISQLTVDQARAEIAGLDAFTPRLSAAQAASRDAEIQKIETNYQVERAHIGTVPPKDEFTSTADYNARVQRAQAAVAELDRNRSAAVAQIDSRYNAAIEAQYKPFRVRIDLLRRSNFSIPAQFLYSGYNADTGRLTAIIGGEEYWFEQVPGETARKLHDHPNQVVVQAPCTETALKSRTLRLTEANIEIKGNSRKEVTEAASVRPSATPQNVPQPQPQNPGQKLLPRETSEMTRRAGELYDAQQYAAAASLYERTCAEGNMYDCVRLGFMYMHAMGVPEDYDRAEMLEAKGCAAGNPYGCNNLAFMEQTVDGNWAKAFDHYSKACDAGHAASCSAIGFLYEGGQGVRQDAAQALVFYNQGCSLGDKWGCEQSKRLQ